ncbi:16S rRNA (guanine(527)-N(7))-methyltransferase RsmG [Pelodictyon phaeoclathratiforme]|jgi:16S rRNA (guanine527-N7)-methyltransferase|uniref:Ribosomal RNA small subunit methyltransferase G n=1 Tax=Pelodictyon phaeoclathratiforme (strain DSM 5477 / BU-1) TaxID=324925 RepID=RSMG_PELPB|nr:16S rRNA (guanine(527)-N(7))-methyltransferase RsmG [Pelodictyon phaeoclathratiforme]B4SC71.1 RecName: Full=Ribosomal RNA small subunit methyltransferase G; AltName: Full=16S rRNA 7-methylguanosine methyltransferase; Short=16S rRNA m7G methyltransferase [Pelodictyon phaeoclathratiforme BU-1]ACF42651.1 methyltransferase GidB [Pelodictyon phaeoclathratiforme BU-1]MBV5289506.1 16S rRNA (guanine(527)-N(7))-methyltransferase RsmG [Pelodictyon phaeoclathratiforme]
MERMNDNVLTLQMLCAEQGMEIDLPTLQQLARYGDCLERWNHKINLISRKEDAPVIIKHIFHSLLITLYHSFREGEDVLDLGTGGGLPGIPLSLLFPRTRFLLVDATGKKIAACQAMITELGINNAIALHTRVEELKGVVFDTVLSRQVAPLDKLCSYSAPLLKAGGTLICLKGGNLENEIAAAMKSNKGQEGFPSKVELHPIHGISPFFSEKQIVIVHGKNSSANND